MSSSFMVNEVPFSKEGLSNVPRICNSVVFPAPDAPNQHLLRLVNYHKTCEYFWL